MPRASVLIVDDEPQIRRVVADALRAVAEVIEASTGAAGLELAATARPALIVLDLGLPDRTGLEVCRAVRAWSTVPIVVLSARHSDREKAELLDAGADDYMTKPFSTLEFTARIRAHLRRAEMPALEAAPGPVEIDDLVIDLAARTLHRGGQGVRLTPIEWELLATLLAHRGRVMTHRQLYDAVWGRAFGDPQQNLRVHVANLRRKIERDPVRPALILTVPGLGYRFETAK
jgi:two-component system KDP operon response regulator KdpE